MPTSPALTDEALLAILRKEEAAASDHQAAALGRVRQDALSFYDREPYGDEQEGLSQVVTSEFADVIESIMPGLMRVFTSSDAVAEFTPAAPGEERWAREASEYVPHVFMRQNDGFRILYWLIKDALMYRLGAVTVDLEPVTEKRRLAVERLPQEALDVIVAQAEGQGVELVLELAPDETPPTAPSAAALSVAPSGAASPPASLPAEAERAERAPATDGQTTLSGTITLVTRRQRVVADNVAPEDVLFTPSARELDGASFVGFRKRVTASDLVEMGLGVAEVEALRSERAPSAEEAQRSDGSLLEGPPRDAEGDSERPLWVVVAYLRADQDGDGVSELLRVVYAHAGGLAGRLLECVEWDGPASIALASPILMSHALVGRSLFDQTQDLQVVGSALMRGLLDNLYLANRPRPIVSDQVNLDSLIDWVPGAPVRLKPGARPDENHVAWLQVPSVAPAALSALEFMATVRENRTGIVRNNQGIDADSLNKTASGMHMLMGAAQQRQELIARVLAETAIKRLYRLVYRAIKRAAADQDRGTGGGPAGGVVRYWRGNGFAACDPRQWPDDMDLSVNVGLGTGNRDQAMQHLGLIGALQEKLLALQGGQANGPFVTAENIANAAQRVTEALGFKSPGLFFQPPERVAAATTAVQAEPASSGAADDPATLAALAQIEIARQAAAAETDVKRMKAAAEIEIAERKARQWADIERFKAGVKAELAAARRPEPREEFHHEQ